MKIGCLGWGSLIWNPQGLPVRGIWFNDGPFLPIEFARQSKDGRMTLVLTSDAAPVRSLWSLLSLDEVEEAKQRLAKREGISEGNIPKHIGVWPSASPTNEEWNQIIEEWATRINLDAVIWTNLPPKFAGAEQPTAPPAEKVLAYLSQLSQEERARAEHYVRMTPRQIDTDYRRLFEEEFNWTPLGER
jgi:hypothetical protein